MLWRITLLSLILLSGCSLQTRPQDPLVEHIYRAADGRELQAKQLLQAMQDRDVIYLGEQHENARHHQIQLQLLRGLIDAGRKPAVGFEFFSIEQTSLLMRYVQGSDRHGAKPMKAQQLRSQLGWQHRPDSEWQAYFQLIEQARRSGLPVFGADLNRDLSQRLSRKGIDGLSGQERRQLQPTGFDDPLYKRLMFEKLTAAHCGWRHEPLLEKLYQTWVARNDAMARSIDAMLDDRPGEPVLMVLGAGHVEYNMAVYERVAALRAGVKQLNFATRPVAIQPQPLADYLQPTRFEGRLFPAAHEYLWFTERVSYEDPCSRFADQLKHNK